MKVRRDRLLWFKWAINCSCKHFILLLSKVLHVLFELGLGQSFCNFAMFYFLFWYIFLGLIPTLALLLMEFYTFEWLFSLYDVYSKPCLNIPIYEQLSGTFRFFYNFAYKKNYEQWKLTLKKKYAWDLKSRRLRDKIPWGVTWNIRSKMVYQSLTKNN